MIDDTMYPSVAKPTSRLTNALISCSPNVAKKPPVPINDFVNISSMIKRADPYVV